MPASQDDLFSRLAVLGIVTETVSHPPLRTVADSQALRGQIPGAHTKNLFLKDRKDQFFLVTLDENAVVDLKTIHTIIGAAGKVSFGNADMLSHLLGVEPGAVTPFGLINDVDCRVKMVFDADLWAHEIINAHPLANDRTTSISRAGLEAFVRSTGREPLVLKVSA